MSLQDRQNGAWNLIVTLSSRIHVDWRLHRPHADSDNLGVSLLYKYQPLNPLMKGSMPLIFAMMLGIVSVDGMVVPAMPAHSSWCTSVAHPPWPFAYQTVPWSQESRECSVYGAQTQCHRCEPIRCGSSQNQTCSYQIQGAEWSDLPINIPTSTIEPWGVGGDFRYDYANASHYCVFLSNECASPIAKDYSSCSIRCWGFQAGKAVQKTGAKWDTWSFPKSNSKTKPQGAVETFAGGSRGHNDGEAVASLFDNPNDLAIDSTGVTYVVDTGNHCIRRIDQRSRVTTFAGNRTRGFRDGPLDIAQYNFPSGIAVVNEQNRVTVYVADTGNHRIRRIRDGQVACIAGRCDSIPHPGFSDGNASESRFDTPLGLAIDVDGNLIVADSGNNLIRLIDAVGLTRTLAGTIVTSRETAIAGCVPPCLEGVKGSEDGDLNQATFDSPQKLAIGRNNAIFVTEQSRIRRIQYECHSNGFSGSVSTLDVSQLDPNERDISLSGIAIAEDQMFVVDSVSCNVLEIQTTSQVAKSISCSTKASQVLVPIGCSSYEVQVVDLSHRDTCIVGNIQYDFPHGEHCELETCVGSSERAQNRSNTAIRLKCPANCTEIDGGKVFGSHTYGDESSICLAAIHNGTIPDIGGFLTIVFQEKELERTVSGSTSNRIVSLDMKASFRSRTFFFFNYPGDALQAHSIAGAPSAPLSTSFGFQDGSPQEARFRSPIGLAFRLALPNDSKAMLLIADAGNHRIRKTVASCSKICENGGNCTDFETCTCASGWKGDDCTIPECDASSECFRSQNRHICVGPNLCACIPGYTDPPNCIKPLCAQQCANGATCVAPDTCSCRAGWYDVNCTTPVCAQTCGNGGNCTSPNTCTCPEQWKGKDCRVPACLQQCINGGSCIAPNTCQCGAGWSGYDCSVPVCSQGFFVNEMNATSSKDFVQYVPCPFDRFCHSVNEFDCENQLKSGQSRKVDVAFGSVARRITGRNEDPTGDVNGNASGDGRIGKYRSSERDENATFGCLLIELGTDAITHFPYLTEKDSVVSLPLYRFSPLSPFSASPSVNDNRSVRCDRQLAIVEVRRLVRGRYACANGGACIAPNVCQCAKGWIGFDCRTPVCSQGYYDPTLKAFGDTTFNETIESIFYDHVETQAVEKRRVTSDGSYTCSLRSISQWERPKMLYPSISDEFYLNHPNYFSAYMRLADGIDRENLSTGNPMDWTPLYRFISPMLDNTREGWRRGGYWEYIPDTHWEKGFCRVQFRRFCTQNASFLDLISLQRGLPVSDTEASFRARSIYSFRNVDRLNYWKPSVYGECTDIVLGGCYNNGSCVAPNVCECASGWKGSNCTVPICEQICFNRGNCTLPNRCTCEVGWTGSDCSIPLCAQECRNGGVCIAPDTCECVQWPSSWMDGKNQPLFQLPGGRPMLTGFTGYDCNTPICVQAEAFLLNSNGQNGSILSLGGHGPYGNLSCTTHRCPQYNEKVVANDGFSFQSGCIPGNPFPNPVSHLPIAKQLELIYEYRDHENRGRISDALCENLEWVQGLYPANRSLRINYVNITRINGILLHGAVASGEGIYMCHHHGACIRPDTCTCTDGYSGFDCTTPSCRFLDVDGKVSTGCRNGGICLEKDTCHCVQVDSLLHETNPTAPFGTTGYIGPDCGIPICIQGVFDPSCDHDGCYRCPNGGRCIAPDVCQCFPGWKGFDCTIPICTASITDKTRNELVTVDERKKTEFAIDPCGMNGGRWGKMMFNGALIGQGNCTLPSKCTCLCRKRYDKAACKSIGKHCAKPWKDPFRRALPPGFIYGTKDCADGFQGSEDAEGHFTSCHLRIFVPSFFLRYTIAFVAVLTISCISVIVCWYYLRKQIRRRALVAKAERRKSRRNVRSNSESFTKRNKTE
uniref:Uncharacterized protein AlNc14C110G6364 n=1 Tax=Albugo laibachii Nc14 TaxID=890382 RepID=F0WIG4_9STRA|nr:conserved hypothetical protein [Albugo laibachii Nc14]|eukprot:CCA21046.1 conserved hypothetical protein [Albugo laibachii Nc14]